MKLAFLGSRGIPASYSGFETFYEQIAVRLAARGHNVTVYNRSHFIKDAGKEYKGVRIVSLPSIPTKHLDTITHTFLSTFHALFQKYDIVYYCIVGNSPLAWIPGFSGARTLLNVDGEDWAREKWSGFARWYQKQCERIAGVTPDVVIADAHVVRDRYRDSFGVEAVFAPYGATAERNEDTDALQRWSLTPRRYILFVGRLVPENGADILIEAFRTLQTDMKLVIAGDAPFMKKYINRLHEKADDRVVFTGYAFGTDYSQLSSHAYLYVQPSAIEGTRPAILDQMGFGNCVVARGNKANREVVGENGIIFDGSAPAESLREVLSKLVKCPEEVDKYRERSRTSVLNYYNWERIADFYEDLFARLLNRTPLIDYDQHLKNRHNDTN
ncbi:MAG: glycosyltransferase [Kiritimatiellia bacterium]